MKGLPPGFCDVGGFIVPCNVTPTQPANPPVAMGPFGLPVSADLAAGWNTAPTVGPLVQVPAVEDGVDARVQSDPVTEWLNGATSSLKGKTVNRPVIGTGDVYPAPCGCWKRFALGALVGAAVVYLWKLKP